MKRTASILGVVAAACWVAVGSAQSTTAGQGSQSGSQSGSYSHSSSSIKLTGCLQADPSGSGYILTNVTEASSSSTSGTSGSGSSTGSGTAGSGSSSAGSMSEPSSSAASENKVELIAGATVDLKEHVGHRVEITGTPTPKSSSSSSSASDPSSSTSGTSGSVSGSSEGSLGTSGEGKWKNKQIRVSAVRMLSSSCSAE